MHKNENEVVSVWGKIPRREMLRRIGIVGLAMGAAPYATLAQAVSKPNDVKSPYNPVPGQPFRSFEPPKGDVAGLFKNAPLKAEGRLPHQRQRDAFWYSKPNSAVGIDIFQYTQSRNHLSNSCAQAACATLLQRFNMVPAGLSGDAVTDRIYQTHPPDLSAGTSIPTLVNAIQAYGMNSWSGYGADHGEYKVRQTLRQWIAAGYPCVVLLDMREPIGRPGTAYFGHYVVVFAYDEDEANGHVYMSNWDYTNWSNSWSVFKRAWSLPDYPSRSYPLVIGWH